MADNYLEKRYEEIFSGKSQGKIASRPSLDNLLAKNNGPCCWDANYQIHPRQLDSIVSVNAKISFDSPLHFRCVYTPEEIASVGDALAKAAYGDSAASVGCDANSVAATGYVVVCAEQMHDNRQYIEVGMSAQSMLLKAVEMGLRGILLTSFDAEALQENLHLSLRPLLVLAFGKVQK